MPDRDWLERGEGGATRFSKMQKYGVTGRFQNVVVHQLCIKSFLFVYPSVLNALPTTAFSDCFQMPWARGSFLSLVPLRPIWETTKDITREKIKKCLSIQPLSIINGHKFCFHVVGRWMLFWLMRWHHISSVFYNMPHIVVLYIIHNFYINIQGRN